MRLWPEIARLASEVVKEQGFASADKSMSTDLFRFLHFLQEKAEKEERLDAVRAPSLPPQP